MRASCQACVAGPMPSARAMASTQRTWWNDDAPFLREKTGVLKLPILEMLPYGTGARQQQSLQGSDCQRPEEPWEGIDAGKTRHELHEFCLRLGGVVVSKQLVAFTSVW